VLQVDVRMLTTSVIHFLASAFVQVLGFLGSYSTPLGFGIGTRSISAYRSVLLLALASR
jgi:hypothetical protein